MKIGLEIHVQLPTKSKMFCSCSTTDAPPNTNICPTCLGMPGSRPSLNKKVLEYGIMLAKMMDCKIADVVSFSRKTYFYPDMSKSFQITQYDDPIGRSGVYYLDKKSIHINRIHLEEDPGKTKRTEDQSSLIDYNRSGIPLAEIVTEPDISTPSEAREFLRQLIADIRYVIGIPNNGERSIRCDCNISVGTERCEIKNVTGLKNVERALTFEMIRQMKIIKSGGTIYRETRRFDELRGVTISVRKKEFEADYGYINEPDLGVYHIKKLKDLIAIRESPQKMIYKLSNKYKIDKNMAKQLVATSISLSNLFETVANEFNVQNAIRWVVGPISANWKIIESKNIDVLPILDIIRKFANNEITDTECNIKIRSYIKGGDLPTEHESINLDELINNFLDENPSLVMDYKTNKNAINKVIGFTIRNSNGVYSSTDVVSAAKKLIESRGSNHQ